MSDTLKTWPERIYLQHGTDENPPAFMGSENGEVTWAQDNIEGNDVEYIRADLVKQALTDTLPQTVAGRERLIWRHVAVQPLKPSSGPSRVTSGPNCSSMA